MQQQIAEAIQLLELARALSAELAAPIVTQTVELLVGALKDSQGVDLDKGGGS